MNLKIELSEQEANALLQLVNIAVKAEGLGAAQAGLMIQQRIQEAAQAVQAAQIAARAEEPTEAVVAEAK